MNDVFLLLGSNMGSREWFLQQATLKIGELIAVPVKVSSVYETKAWGKTDEPDYLNQVLWLQTTMPPSIVLQTVLDIEKQLGRERKQKWGSRTIDIDILFYGDEVINLPELVIPHPQLHLRKFTLAPLAEIAPDLVHPFLNKTIAELNAMNDDEVIKLA